MIDNNLNLSNCGVKVNCQITKFKITKLKQQVMPTYCHIDSTDVIKKGYTGVPELADQIETVYSLMVMKVKNV
jgi:hypothetical protein